MTEGSCHCGTVHWRCDGTPELAEACSCTICRRYGVLWAYGLEGKGIDVSGATQSYVPRNKNAFHFCSACGCLAYWRELAVGPNGLRRIGVNLRLAQPEEVAQIPVERVDGLRDFEHLPLDGRRVADYWF